MKWTRVLLILSDLHLTDLILDFPLKLSVYHLHESHKFPGYCVKSDNQMIFSDRTGIQSEFKNLSGHIN